jgi:hypothetical protein
LNKTQSYPVNNFVEVERFILSGILSKMDILQKMLSRRIKSPLVYDELLCIRLEVSALLGAFHSGRGKLRMKHIQSPKLAYMACRPILNKLFGYTKAERELIFNGRPTMNYYDYFISCLYDVHCQPHHSEELPNFIRKFEEVFEQKYICGKACSKCFKTFATPMMLRGFDSHSCLSLEKGLMMNVTDCRFTKHYKMLFAKLNPDQRMLLERVVEDKFNIFLTGFAGTGKSLSLTVAVLQYLLKYGMYTFAVISPTKVAAGLVGGITYHSFLNVPVPPQRAINEDEPLLPLREVIRSAILHANRMSQTTPHKCLSMKFALRVIFIDECGMLSHDQLVFLDYFLRTIRDQPKKTFGGVRVILCGDVLQLPPMVKQKKIEQGVRPQRHPVYFFESASFLHGSFIVIYLKVNHRQANNEAYSYLLNLMRDGKMKQYHCDIVSDTWGSAVSFECVLKVINALHDQFDKEILENLEEDLIERADPLNCIGNSKWGKMDTLMHKMRTYWNPDLLPAYYKMMYNQDTHEPLIGECSEIYL